MLALEIAQNRKHYGFRIFRIQQQFAIDRFGIDEMIVIVQVIICKLIFHRQWFFADVKQVLVDRQLLTIEFDVCVIAQHTKRHVPVVVILDLQMKYRVFAIQNDFRNDVGFALFDAVKLLVDQFDGFERKMKDMNGNVFGDLFDDRLGLQFADSSKTYCAACQPAVFGCETSMSGRAW